MFLFCSGSSIFSQEPFRYQWEEEDHRFINGIIDDLTLQEKLQLIAGVALADDDPSDGSMDNFGIRGIPEKGIPDLIMGHGITGVRAGRDLGVKSTYFGTPMAYASTWDPDLYERVGVAIAREMRALGQDLNLGPTLNIIRHPLGGRNWECYSEDPFLISRFIVPYVHAMQSGGVICGPKHFVANNQDHNRFDINSVIDERTLREVYLPAFKASVTEGGALNIMGAYNRLNGVFMCHRRDMLTGLLRNEWGFNGFVVSDANEALRSTLGGVYAGCDVDLKVDEEEGEERVYGQPLGHEIEAGNLPVCMVDSMVYRVLKTMHLFDIFDRPKTENPEVVHSAEHRELAGEVAAKAPVLLKNSDGLLPADPSGYKKVAVIGPQATPYPGLIPGKGNYAYYLQGGGSGRTYYFPEAMVDPLTGLQERYAPQSEVVHAPGCLSPLEYRDNREAGESREEQRLIREARSLARKSELSILLVGLSGFNESEAWDRTSVALPGHQESLISEVAGVSDNTVVVLISGSFVDVSPWIDEVDALIYVPYSGEKIGEGIASLLAGDVAPSGKLSISWPYSVDDYPEGSIHTGPGYSANGISNVYSEGIYVGYRWFDNEEIETRFPFGYGLTYTTFDYSGLDMTRTGDFSCEVTFTVRNTGERQASEIAQLYVSDPVSTLDRPVKELKGFCRVELEPGESKECMITLDRLDFSYYDSGKGGWVAEPGEFLIQVGPDSGRLPLSEGIRY